MVLVSSLVMHPGKRIAKNLAFLFVGTASSEVIFRAWDKLCGRILGKIVKKPLKTDPRLETMADNGVAVLGYGVKMFDRM
jgi:hypothetical protein